MSKCPSCREPLDYPSGDGCAAMTKHKPNRGVNEALRRAGFKRLPAWWVTEAEFDVIWRMAHNHEEHINEIRAFYRNRDRDDATSSVPDGKPD